MSSTDRPACLDKALELLALRPHFEAELRRKLTQRSYEGAEIDTVCSALRADGVLDDLQIAFDFCAQRRRRRGEGPHRLRQELLRRGVASDIVSQVLQEDRFEEDLETARELGVRRFERGANEASIGRFLTRKGYGKRVILLVLEELRQA